MSLGSKENSAQICSVQIAQVPGQLKSCSYLSLHLHISFRSTSGFSFVASFFHRVQISLFIRHCSAWSCRLLNMKMNVLDMSPALCNAHLLKNKEQDIVECITLRHELSHPLYLNLNSFGSQVGYLGQCFVCRLHLLRFLYIFIFLG